MFLLTVKSVDKIAETYMTTEIQMIEIFSISKAEVFTEITISHFAVGEIFKSCTTDFFGSCDFSKSELSKGERQRFYILQKVK